MRQEVGQKEKSWSEREKLREKRKREKLTIKRKVEKEKSWQKKKS